MVALDLTDISSLYETYKGSHNNFESNLSIVPRDRVTFVSY